MTGSNRLRVLPALLKGSVQLPISKSLAHRRLFCLFLAAWGGSEVAAGHFEDWLTALRTEADLASDDLKVTATVLKTLLSTQSASAPLMSDCSDRSAITDGSGGQATRVLMMSDCGDRSTIALDSGSQDAAASLMPDCSEALEAPASQTETTDKPLNPTQAAVRAADASDGLHLPCGESGTTLRLLIPVVLALGRPATLTGQGRLPQRPLHDYAKILQARGAKLDFSAALPDNSLPLKLSGRLQAGTFQVPGNVSSQYLSGLLFALPLLNGDSVIKLTSPLESASYVDLTLDALREFGIRVDARPDDGHGTWFVPGDQQYQLPADLSPLEVDASQAAFFHLANYLGQQIEICQSPHHSRQGDAVFPDIMGELLAIRQQNWPNGTVIPGTKHFQCTTSSLLSSENQAHSLDVSQIPDLVPALALACATTPGTFRLIRAGRLRLKESDRLLATVIMLQGLGIDASEHGDEIWIQGRRDPLTYLQQPEQQALPLWFKGGPGQTFQDHRLMMCLSMAGCVSTDGIELDHVTCVQKSYPAFLDDLTALGGRLERVNPRSDA